jgi:hypothetical protein
MKRNYNYRKIKRKTSTLPLLLTFVRGAIGKEYVIKHYRYGIVKTKYPDMTRIIASERQRSCRDLFKAAVAHAQKVMADPVQKAAWLKKLRQKHLVFNMIIKEFMLEAKKAAKQRELTGKYLVRSCFGRETRDQKKYWKEKPAAMAGVQVQILLNHKQALGYRQKIIPCYINS